jgi:hypothetical protein
VFGSILVLSGSRSRHFDELGSSSGSRFNNIFVVKIKFVKNCDTIEKPA